MKLSYGNGICCEIPDTGVTRVCVNKANTINDRDLVAAIRAAFARPIDFPNLASATVPGDTVTIALEYQTPQIHSVVAGALSALEHAGVERASVTILLASEFAEHEDLQRSLRELVGGVASIVVHSADSDEQLSLLGVTQASRSLRLNRLLCDADLVIPIGLTRSSASDAERIGMTFPRFSDLATQARFHSPSTLETTSGREKLAAEIQECDWMLGVNLALQVVPGPEGSVAGVYCGTPTGVAVPSRRTYEEVWSTQVEHRADLVIATIVGDEMQQTWQNLGRALAIADGLLATGGAVAICSEIATRPGPSGKRLRDAADLADTERRLLKDEYPDSVAALRLCRALQRGTVYLKSRLDTALVERFGLAPIESDHELERLVQTYRRCLVLEESQYLEPILAI